MTEAAGRIRAPAGTTIRFALLVTLALGAAVSILSMIMPPGVARVLDAFDLCQVRAGVYTATGADLNLWRAAGQQDGVNRFGACLTEQVPERPWWIVAGVAALVAVAALLRFVQPYWLILRRRLVPLDPGAAGPLLGTLHAWAAAAGLRRPPVFLVDPVSGRLGGLAFGSNTRPFVSLDAGLLSRLRTDPTSVRAVVLHELAHVRNRDVSITYTTMAVWRAFLLVALLPWALALLLASWNAEHVGLAVESAARILILVLIVYLSRNAVLRSRERYADAQVARWLGSTEPAECLPASGAAAGHRWGSWWRAHPAPHHRVAGLAHPASLLRPGFWESFAAGLAFEVAWLQLAVPVQTWSGVPQTALELLQRSWGLGLAVLIIVLALRTAAYRAAGHTSPWVLVGPGLGIVAGIVLGESLTVLYGSTLLPRVAGLAAGLSLAPQVILLTAWLAWVAGLVAAREPGRLRRLAAVAAGAAVVGFCVSWLQWWSALSRMDIVVDIVRQTQGALLRIVDVAWTGLDHALVSVVLHPIVLGFAEPDPIAMVSLVLIWAVPLLLGAARAGLRFALFAGLLAGAALLGYDLVLRAALRNGVAEPLRTTEGMVAVLTAWEIGAVVLAQFLVAVVVTARRPNPVTGLFAAATTGLVGAAGIWVLHATDACVPVFQATMTTCPLGLDPGYGATVLGVITAEGTLLALTGAALGYLAGRRREFAEPAARRLRPQWIAATAVMVLSAVLLGWPRPVATAGGPIERATAAERSAPAAENAEALRIWLRAGGGDHLDAIAAAVQAIGRAAGAGGNPTDLAAV
ncbi:M48 family metalloprotease, partial [Actinophytocola sp.]|uniref:M48 family metalloprotease n=1 Tax=Actinophytocola sp. TaxID=1872138 RepID=UPI002D7FAFB2